MHDYHFVLLFIFLICLLNSIRYFFWSRYQLIKFELINGNVLINYLDFNKSKAFKSAVDDLVIYRDATFSIGPLSFLVLKNKNMTLRFYGLLDFDKTQIIDIVNTINKRSPANILKRGASRQNLNYLHSKNK